MILLLLVDRVENDCLQFPIKNGIITPNRPNLHQYAKAIEIKPSIDFNVHACLSGIIGTIWKREEGYFLAMKSDSITIIYSLIDSVTVKEKDFVRKGDIVGVQKGNNPIVFAVYISRKEVEAIDYVSRKKCDD